MKKQLILVLAFFTLSLAACEEEVLRNYPIDAAGTPSVKITSFYPESAAWGTAVTLFGENFGATTTDNYVTFDGAYAEVIQVQSGTVVVRVPQHLAAGDYTISLTAHGQTATLTKIFKIIDPRF